MDNMLLMVQFALSQRASDIHLVAGSQPLMRVDGQLRQMTDTKLMTPADIDEILRQIASSEQMNSFEKNMELDFSQTLPDMGRIRCNASKQRGMTSLAIRLVPSTVPSIEELGLPALCRDLVCRPRGLIVVSGPTGSGKSTTLSAMINYLNTIESRRVITVEDPIEYVYTNERCVITQRELGSDTHSFAEALKHILRQDPNVILVGEMRDYETAAAVLTIAETGHLVLTTGHATSAAQTVERIIDLFPADERLLAQARLASFINAILCQILVPKADGNGRVVAVEIMLASPATRNTIREGRIHQLPNAMVTQARQGNIMLDNVLIRLYRDGLINYESMLAACNEPDEINKLITEPQAV